MYDAPYRIEKVYRGGDKDNYEIHRTGDGHILTAHDFATARETVDALNKLELERLLQRAA